MVAVSSPEPMRAMTPFFADMSKPFLDTVAFWVNIRGFAGFDKLAQRIEPRKYYKYCKRVVHGTNRERGEGLAVSSNWEG